MLWPKMNWRKEILRLASSKSQKKGLEIRTVAKNRSLNVKERLYAYAIPFYISIGRRSTFYKRLDKEFQDQIKEFMEYGEDKKAEEFIDLKKKDN